jgi:hypothetical protein
VLERITPGTHGSTEPPGRLPSGKVEGPKSHSSRAEIAPIDHRWRHFDECLGRNRLNDIRFQTPVRYSYVVSDAGAIVTGVT